jgi:RHS repeat-associated protein
MLEETNASGVAQADYIYLNGRPVAVLNGSTLYYLHDDMLGTPQLATDTNQAVAWQASYDPFGQASVSGTITQNLRLPGQYFDVESGWNHNGFRDYAPQLGRYVEPDPLGRLGSGNNLYAYVAGNPINFTDPLGLKCGCNSQTSRDDPNNLALFPTDVSPNNYHILYRLRTADGQSIPLDRWYVFEHQTQSGGGRTPYGQDNVSPDSYDKWNTDNFDDTLGGGGLDTVQKFTISLNPKYNPNAQCSVMIRWGNHKDYGAQGIYQFNPHDPVLINGVPQVPGWNAIKGEF